MAYRRCLSIRATLLARRSSPSFGYISHENDRDKPEDLRPSASTAENYSAQRRSFGGFINSNSWRYSGAVSRSGSELFRSGGLCMNRFMSTSIGEAADKIDYLSDVTTVITDVPIEAVTSQAAVLNEVAVAAADSAFPVAALQYLIEGVHSFTGLNWWASIALTSFLIRGLTVPLLIGQLKATTKLTLLRPRLEEIKEEIQATGMEPEAVAEGQKKMKDLFKEHGVSPFTLFRGMLIQAPIFISFFFAITNMAEKVPSFKNGGALWFTDLTTPDAMYIFPILTGLTFLVTIESNAQEGLEGNPIAGPMKKVFRALALAIVPLTMNFPKALFCYWVTSNIFSFFYGFALKIPGVKKALGVPEIPIPSPSDATQKPQPTSIIEALKQLSSATQNTSTLSTPDEQSKSADKKQSSSAAALSRRLRDLEQQVKEKKGRKE